MDTNNINKIITTDALGTQPKVNFPSPTVTPNPLAGTIAGQVDGSVTDLAQVEADRISAEKKQSEGDISSLLKDIGLVKGTETTVAAGLGAETAQQDINKYSKELIGEQRAFELAKRDIIANNPQGALRGGQQDLLNNLERASLQKQADIAILKAGAQGDYETANKIAKDRVDAELAPMQAELDAKKFIYDNNKDLFSAAEKNKLETLQRTEQAKLDEERKKKEAAMDMITLAIGQQAPSSLISKAQGIYNKGGSIIEIASALGKYSTDYLSNEIKKASLTKTNAEIDKIRADMKASSTVIDTSNTPNTVAGTALKLMASAKNDKQLDAAERQSLSKARTVIGQLDSLGSNIKKQNKTGFFKGNVNNLLEKVGLNADVGVINAQLQAITPNLARGIYGEVGVLTDSDIRLYRTTLPRLTRGQDQNDAIMAMTLKTVAKSIENTLTGAANSGIDVSGWTKDYISINKQIMDIEDRIGISKEGVNVLVQENKALAPAIKEMYQQGLTDGEILEALNSR